LFNVGNQFGTSLSTHISKFDDIGQCLIFAVLWWPFWKWRPVEIYKKWGVKIQHCPISSKFDMWVDNDVPNWFPTLNNFYRSPFSNVSIIIHLEIININVRNFNFPIGFYSNPHPLWTPQNMTLTPFITKLKTLGPTRNIYFIIVRL
jgi:hypothetical protein